MNLGKRSATFDRSTTSRTGAGGFLLSPIATRWCNVPIEAATLSEETGARRAGARERRIMVMRAAGSDQLH
jgi:hypothetical protein